MSFEYPVPRAFGGPSFDIPYATTSKAAHRAGELTLLPLARRRLAVTSG